MMSWPIAEVLPQSGSMILLDAVTCFDADSLTATATVRPGGLFNEPDGSLPAWVGIELMAQAIAAWAGCHARAANTGIKMGFLLGTRQYTSTMTHFPAGSALQLCVERTLQDNSGMGIFVCELHCAGQLAAQARVNVFQPADASALIHESTPTP